MNHKTKNMVNNLRRTRGYRQCTNQPIPGAVMLWRKTDANPVICVVDGKADNPFNGVTFIPKRRSQ